MDIILHCLDPGHLKTKPLNEVFPAVCRFNQVRFPFYLLKLPSKVKLKKLELRIVMLVFVVKLQYSDEK
jgi:hypothetical protein